MDDDVNQMSRDQLVDEVKRLRAGISEHRDSSGQDLCWHHPAPRSLLPEKSDPLPQLPSWPDFMAGCIKYSASLERELTSKRSPEGQTR